tara:strand:- start:1487 stop:1597 length:111 start_codon:yes stop_codon:yes gene_type:complete
MVFLSSLLFACGEKEDDTSVEEVITEETEETVGGEE